MGINYQWANQQSVAGGLSSSPSRIRSAVYANYRNSTTQTVNINRAPLLVDGLRSLSFNKMPFPVWDADNSKIRPPKSDELYLVRINLKSTATTSTVISIELDVNGAVLASINFQPKQMTEAFDSGLMMFYAGSNFVNNGGTLFVWATDEVSVSETSLLLVRLAATEN